MKVFTFGKTKIRIYGGLNTIGGNCVVIESHSIRIMLDQGVNFTWLEKFYGFTIQPDSVDELREMHVLPPEIAYENVDVIYVSHLHLDHLGSLNIPRDVPAYLPSRDIAELLSRGWWFGWRQQLLPKTLSFTGFRNVEDGREVSFARVSHSAFPSYAFRVEADDVSIIYSGDLRLESPYPNISNTLDSLRGLAEDRTDVLIIEGTNFGRRMNYLTVPYFEALLKDLLNRYDRRVLYVSVHPLDLEVTLRVLELLWERGFTPVFVNPYYAKLMDIQMNNVNYEIEGRELYFTPPKTSGLYLLDSFETAYITELRDRAVAIFIPIPGVKDVVTTSKLLGVETSGLLHITVLGEPLSEEWVIEERKVSNWLKLLGLTSLRLHLSGHYYPHEFKEIIDAVKPRTIIPIHTKAPNTMLALFNKYKQ